MNWKTSNEMRAISYEQNTVEANEKMTFVMESAEKKAKKGEYSITFSNEGVSYDVMKIVYENLRCLGYRVSTRYSTFTVEW